MLNAAVRALQEVFSYPHILFVLLGSVVGLVAGAVPGLGGVVGLSLLLPFTYALNPLDAVACAIGIYASTTISDIIPAILLGVPGSNAAQATILDGHAMARRGEAGRALGASYMSALIGGLFGAVMLAFIIPLIRPIVLAFASPEFFMLSVFGLTMVATLSGRAPLRGFIVAALGLTAGTVGSDPQTGVFRFAFGQTYLFDHLPLVPLALGFFALPELIDMMLRGTSIAGESPVSRSVDNVVAGMRDALKHWFLILRCSVLGAWLAALPGMGGSAINWLAYGHAYQTEKGAHESFGKGDVRGVIAPDCSSNAMDGGALVPTIGFGIPGSAGMALILSVFLIEGIQPGPSMFTTNLSLSYALVWSLLIAHVFGTIVCLLLSRYSARITTIPIRLLAPVVIGIVFAAALQSSGQLGDIIVLVVAGACGWTLKRLGWPRPPFILAFVLSPIMEKYYYITTTSYGASWLSRPGVIVIGVLVLISIAVSVRRNMRASRNAPSEGAPPEAEVAVHD